MKIRGTVSEFRGTPQITVDRIRLADDNDTYDLSALVPVAPIDVDTTMEEVERLISSITDADYRKICSTMMARHKESLKTIPAAKSVHHGFISGLLMHTAAMMKTADFLAGLYVDIIDRSLLLAGTFLHDFAKEKEFTFFSARPRHGVFGERTAPWPSRNGCTGSCCRSFGTGDP